MRVIIPREQERIIKEKIYLDLEVDVLKKKVKNANSEKDYVFLERKLKVSLENRRKIKSSLQNEQITIYPSVKEGWFVQYDFSVKMKSGFTEGNFRFWIAVMKSNLNKRLNNL